MISIITAVHNQLSINKIFLKYIKKYTDIEYELIIIDNNSTDGSREFFEKQDVKLIKNNDNFSYPYCQNQGIKEAKYDILIFLNNDIIVSKKWASRTVKILKEQDLDVASIRTNDVHETTEATRKIKNRWKAAKNPVRFLFGQKKISLLLMHKLMYGNWDKFTEKQYADFNNKIFEGISGAAVIVTKKGIEKIGLWDERIQAADFDIYLRTKERHINSADIKTPKIIAGVYIHHFSRLSSKKNTTLKALFRDYENIISITEKWSVKKANKLLENTQMRVS